MESIVSDIVSRQTGLGRNFVFRVIQLLEEGATIPFLARYRKELTGGMDEIDLESIRKTNLDVKELLNRKEYILKSLKETGNWSNQIEEKIKHCFNKSELEDIYLPFKPKRKTRAEAARALGLEPLASAIYHQRNEDPYRMAFKFVGKDVASVEEAIKGASDIIAEWISEDTSVRNKIRMAFEKGAVLHARVVKGKEQVGQKYRDYFSFEESLKKCPSHRVLAVRRGENEGFLKVSIQIDDERAIEMIQKIIVFGNNACSQVVHNALLDAYKRLLIPSIETEFKQVSKIKADQEAVVVFRSNLKQLLMAPPLGEKKILAIDPGFRSGCKMVTLDNLGNLLNESIIYPHPPQSNLQAAEYALQTRIVEDQIDAIAIGNGTAGKETFRWIKGLKLPESIQVYLVNESGASIYSASEAGRDEFPDYDLTVRGAISIGRRLMDPLAELVKIDPQSIGVGQYQHDVDQGLLKEGLDQTVINCVNSVGVNLNTASKHLLSYISGLGPSLAQSILNYRREIGAFISRDQLKNVPRLGAKTYEQCAGFLRIKNGEDPLDNTSIHPERYDLVRSIASDLEVSVTGLVDNPALLEKVVLSNYSSQEVGLPTLQDIVKELSKPGIDPRGEAEQVAFSNIESIDDLEVGMQITGVVNNITNFGAFLDIGIKQSAFLHISQISSSFIKNPSDVLFVGQEVRVKIMEIDKSRERISVSLLL